MQALVVGAVVWAVVSVLKVAAHVGFHGLTAAMDRAPSIVLVLVPLLLGAVIVATIARRFGTNVYYRDDAGTIHELNAIEGDGLERAIALYFTSEPSAETALVGVEGVGARWQFPTLRLALQKMLATVVTLSTGGSGGLEASVTLIGESTASSVFKPRAFIQRWLPRHNVLGRLARWWHSASTEDLQVAQLCGIAAAVATLLGTPFFAAFFAIEVMYRRRPIIDKLIYALISALVAFFLAHMAGSTSPFSAPPIAFDLLYDPMYYVALLALAVSISVIGLLFSKLRAVLDHKFHHMENMLSRHVLGALATGVIAILAAAFLHVMEWEVPGGDGPGAVVALVLGSGESVISYALVGELTFQIALVALVAKLLATLTTITSGGSAGLLFPTMFFGTTTAVAWAHLFGYDNPLVLIAPALTASLVSIANVPLAAIFVVVELFGATWIVPALVMVVVVSILRQEGSIYRTQHETFDRHEILPGIAIHHLDIPDEFIGRSIMEIDVRRNFGLTVIAVLEASDASGGVARDLELNPSPERKPNLGEQLVAVGDDDAFNRWVEKLANPSTSAQ